jgi:type I restriction enzyme, S subunit
MELKPGYKQSEVGIIPEDWEVKQLRHISPLQSVGLVINPSSYFADHGTVPLLVGSSISENKISWESANCITDASNQLLPSSRLAAGDLVMVRVGEPGTTAVVPPELDGSNCASMMIIRHHKTFDSNWLCYAMNSRLGLKQVEHVQYGTAQKQFNISDAINFSYPVPRVEEQRVIAEVLSDADAFIAALEELLAKKHSLKQGAMQQLLTGKRRLPGFGVEQEYKQTEVGKLPEEWRVETIGDIATVGRGRVISHKEISKSRNAIYPVYSSQTSDNGAMGYIDTFDFEGDYVTWTTDGANAGTVFSRKGNFNCTNVCGTIKLKSDNSVFVSKVLGRIAPRHVSRHLGNPKLMNDVVKHIKVPLPPTKGEQEAIATILSDMDSEIAALETKLNKTRQIKQGMMQELLTGRIRLV